MTTKRLLGLAIVPLIGWATLAAQDRPNPQDPSKTPPTVSKKELKKEVPFCHKATDVIGSDVRSPKNENLGKVEELVLDPASGTIEYAVISFGGFLGMGDKFFAVPFSLLKAPEVPEGGKHAHFTFEVDKAKLEKAPGFEKSNWPDVSTTAWADEIDKFYNTKRAAPASASGDAIDANASTRLCKASDVIGKNIHNMQKENLGEIKELVLDPGRSRVNYTKKKSGHIKKIGDKLFAIPWPAIKVARKENKDEFVLDMSKERFEKAPEYQDKEWGRMSDPNWVREMYGYYGTKPYWSSPPVEK
jgi:sporulation protein YlmC with PRC-barrel domain